MVSKLLIIDDNLDNLISIKALLKNLLTNSDIYTAISGKEGIEMALLHQPDTILLDIQMPDLDGFDVCRILKSKNESKHIPVILLTSKYGDTQSKIKGLETGADAFLSKPIEEEELVAQVKAMLRIKYAEDILRRDNVLLADLIDQRTQQLSISEAKLKTIIDTISSPIFYKNIQGIYTGCNDAFAKFIGFSKEKIIGSTIYNLTNNELAEIYAKADKKLVEEKNTHTYEAPVLHADGTLHDVLFNKSVILSEDGEIDGIVGVITDITDRKKAEEKLKLHALSLGSLIELNELKNKSQNNIISFIIEKAIYLTNSEVGFLGFLNTEEDVVTNWVWSENTLRLCQIKDNINNLIKNAGLWGEVIKQRQPILINNFENDNTLKKGFPDGHIPITRYLSIPHFDNDKIVAIISVANKSLDYDQNDISQLRLLIDGLWSIIKQQRYETDLIKSREKAERSEKQSNKLLLQTRKQKLELETILKGSKAVLDFDIFENTAQKLYNYCKDLLGAKYGLILLNEDKKQYFILNEIEDFYETQYVDSKIENIIENITHAFYINNNQSDSVYQWIITGKTHNILFTPLKINQKIVGLIGFTNKQTDFTDNDLTIAEAFGELASIALFNNQTISELIKSKEKAVESDRLKSAFLANMSHEIRTPMNAIMGFSQLLRKKDLDDDKKFQFIDLINSNCQQLLNIINDILDISKIEAGQAVLKIAKTNINNIITEIYSTYLPIAEKTNLQLFYKLGLDNQASEINTDGIKLRQIIQNLVSNALKFTHKGYIHFGYELKNNELEFFVEDTGIGIDKENYDKIFERFRQVEITLTRKYGGTGLGLSISKSFVVLLGGKIWLNSELNKGTTFYFTIPYERLTNDTVKSTDKKSSDNKYEWNDRTILIAEDELSNFLILQEMLANTKVKILHAQTGVDAIELYKANQTIDLILMDIKMPEMNGIDATIQLKSLNPKTIIIAQTAYALHEEIEKIKSCGFDNFITKPIQEEILFKTLSNYLY